MKCERENGEWRMENGGKRCGLNNNSAKEQNSYPQMPLKFLNTLLPENYFFMKNYVYLILFLLFLPLIYFRDFTPNNELRYLSIAEEALQNGNLFTFSDHGIPYADKPPLYLWLIMLGKSLFGEYHMWFLSLFSLIPALLILYVMDKWTAPFLSQGRLSSQLMLITSGFFTGSAIVLRMDMLMCLFIVLSLFTFYRLYEGSSQKKNKILLPVYIFLALFTKGPVGLLLPLLSIAVFLLLQKRLQKFPLYFGGRQWLILLGLCAGWFLAIYAEGGSSYLRNLLFHQTFDRAVQAFHHQEPFYYYLLALWYALAPWSLFYVLILLTALFKRNIRTPLEKFYLTIIVVTFVMLSVFSSKLAIYLLPAFPFFTYLSFLLLPRTPSNLVHIALFIPAIVFVLTLPALYLLQHKLTLPFLLSLQASVTVLTGSALLALYFLYRKYLYKPVNLLSSGILATLFIGSFALPQLNPYIGLSTLCRQAEEIAHELNIGRFYFYNFRSGEYLDIYLKNDIRPIRPEDLGKLSQEQDFILFLRNKDLLRNRELQHLFSPNALHQVGNYSFFLSAHP